MLFRSSWKSCVLVAVVEESDAWMRITKSSFSPTVRSKLDVSIVSVVVSSKAPLPTSARREVRPVASGSRDDEDRIMACSAEAKMPIRLKNEK